VPTPASSLSAVVISGGKQYRVSPGDRILVDRMAGEPGSEVTLDRVLLLADGEDVKVGIPGVEGVTVTARVIGAARGPKIDVLRYKSKKRVRVHRGARADLTALEILTVGGKGIEKPAKAEKAAKKADKKADKTADKTADKKPAGAESEVAEKPSAEAQPAAGQAEAVETEEGTDGA
jgi:large subunit ribosomal protein L21